MTSMNVAETVSGPLYCCVMQKVAVGGMVRVL
jgi:hypothetical protein